MQRYKYYEPSLLKPARSTFHHFSNNHSFSPIHSSSSSNSLQHSLSSQHYKSTLVLIFDYQTKKYHLLLLVLCTLPCSVPYLIDEFQIDRVFVHLYQFPCFLVPSILSYDHIVHTLSTFEIVAYKIFLNEYLICL